MTNVIVAGATGEAVNVEMELIGDYDILSVLEDLYDDTTDAEEMFDEVRLWSDGYKMVWTFDTFVYDNTNDIEAGCMCSVLANGCICVGMYSNTGSVKELYARWHSIEQKETFLNAAGTQQMFGTDDLYYNDYNETWEYWIGDDPDAINFVVQRYQPFESFAPNDANFFYNEYRWNPMLDDVYAYHYYYDASSNIYVLEGTDEIISLTGAIALPIAGAAVLIATLAF